MSTNQNEENIKRLFVEVFTDGRLEVCDELLSPEVKLHDPMVPEFHGGVQGWKEWEGTYKKAFPHKKAKIDDLVSSGDKVVVRWSVDGKQEGDLPGVPATGKEIKITGIMIAHFSGGKIDEMWNNWDTLGLYRQLGVDQLPR